MKILNYFSFILVFLMLNTRGASQKLTISGEFGASFKTNSFANGYGFNLNTSFIHAGNHHFGLTLGNNFMSSSHLLPGKKLNEYNFHLRDYTNIYPIGKENYLFLWNIESFEPIRLRSQPNRYYNFNCGINYFYEFKKLNSLKIGSELVLTYRDQMEIAKVLNAKKIEFWFPLVKYDYNIPIYAYDTYLDIGIAPFVQYNLFKYKRLDIDIKTKVYIFPKSGEMIYNFGAVMAWKKTKEIEKSKTKPHKKRKKH